jgi:hypothetical protein
LSMLVVGVSGGLALRPSAEVAVPISAVTCPCGECETGCDCCNDGECTCEVCACDVCDSGTCGTTECCADKVACPAGECDASVQCSGSGCNR